MSHTRNISFEVVRVLAAFYIIFFWHQVNYINLDTFKTESTQLIALVCLGTFFVMSGYFLTLGEKITSAKNKKSAIVQFYVKRLLRIYPLYAFAVLTFFMLEIGDWTWLRLLLSLTLLAAIFDLSPLTLWFVNVIFLFYIIAPFFWKYTYSSLRILAFGATFFAILVLLNQLTDFVDERLFIYFPSFLFGMLIGKEKILHDKLNSLAFGMISGVSAAIILFIYYAVGFPFLILNIVIPILSLPFLLNISKLLVAYMHKSKLIEYCSTASFAAYLFHRPIFEVSYQVIPKNNVVSISAVIIATIVISYLIQRFYTQFITRIF